MDPTTDDVAELRRQLEATRLEASREKTRASSYAAQIEELKRQNLTAHRSVEQEEEALTNNLMKKLEKVNSEKREMLMRVEQEEEFLTNSLQKRLDRVMREKLELEAQVAREHTQLDKASGDLERRLEALSSERERLSAEKVELGLVSCLLSPAKSRTSEHYDIDGLACTATWTTIYILADRGPQR